MKIFMTGGTGFVGSFLSRELVHRGHEVTILTRRTTPTAPAHPRIAYVTGDPTAAGDWMTKVPGHDWVINLAGASIFSYWTEKKKKEIYDSRILSTRHLVRAIAQGEGRTVLCSTSAPGYYGDRGEELLTEGSSPGDDFLSQVARDWETEALKAQDLGLRVVITRFGIVLGQGRWAPGSSGSPGSTRWIRRGPICFCLSTRKFPDRSTSAPPTRCVIGNWPRPWAGLWAAPAL